jgi:heptosyltransferase III
LRKIKKILVIIQRSNGDVFLSASLINNLYKFYNSPDIDLLVNEDTLQIAKLIPNIKFIHTFSYNLKKNSQLKQEKKIFKSIFKKYDLSINLTASDRSVIYAFLAGKKSISAIEQDKKKSWWKKALLNHYYFFDTSKHILLNNLTPLSILGIKYSLIQHKLEASSQCTTKIKNKLYQIGVEKFMIFHPSAQYQYKILPQNLRNQFLSKLNSLGVSLIVTGGFNQIDSKIKKELKTLNLSNVYDFIGLTTLDEYLALSELSIGYVGMDTLNMHIAAAQNKRIFAIFGPTNLKMWSPWSNELRKSAKINVPVQTYGNITIFQANMPCVACGKAGCENSGNSICLDNIDLNEAFKEINTWIQNVKL